jgi:hypothetical protein
MRTNFFFEWGKLEEMVLTNTAHADYIIQLIT